MNRFAIAFAALASVAPAAAQTPVSVPAFDSIELRGGGRVTIRQGASQRVTLVRGSPEMTRFTVDRDGELRIDACVRSCRNYDLVVEIVTPGIDAVAIHGGGQMRAEGSFARRTALAAAIHGGGLIDVTALGADSVAAAINGGGSIRTHPRVALAVSINGGGTVVYEGDPAVSTNITGGGTVHRAGRR